MNRITCIADNDPTAPNLVALGYAKDKSRRRRRMIAETKARQRRRIARVFGL